MTRNSGHYNRVDGYLKPIFGVSANTYYLEHNPSSCYQDPHRYGDDNTQGKEFTIVYQTMNPYGVEEDVRMWYQITCVYNGGPVGYYKTVHYLKLKIN